MQIQTILVLILAAFVALGLVCFQYFYKNKTRGKLPIILSFLRFITLFSIFLLVINPKFIKKDFLIEKTNLVILSDNSSSVKQYRKSIETVLEKIRNNINLNEKFEVKEYKFGEQLEVLDSLNYKDSNTDISQALKGISDIYSKQNTIGVLVSDGNQTIGEDYEFYANKLKYPVYTVIIGDTNKYEDIRITQVNTNKYAFLKNKFPVEFYVSYDGNNTITAPITINVDGKTVYKNQVQFSKTDKTKRINTFLEANTIGLKTIKLNVEALKNEKNTVNNYKTIAVEVIDEKTNVAIVSSISHPDIGVLKKAIETNEQRSVSIINPNMSFDKLNDVDLFVLYQPDASFDKMYNYISNKKANTFIIVGIKTDLNFLNRVQKQFQIETGYPIQEVFGVVNQSFSKFDISDFNLNEFPPLQSAVGEVTFSNASESLLQMNIKGIDLPNSLLTITDSNDFKLAVFFGEDIWKWRLQAYRNDRNFENFDQFIGKLMLFLSETKQKDRLNIQYQPIYEGVGSAKITATYFDEAFIFNANANLILKLNGDKEIPMLLKGNYYEADLSDLNSGYYDFEVTISNEDLKKSGKFTILDFDVEQQFLSSNYKKMQNFTSNTNGELFYANEIDDLLEQLNSNNQFLPTQKSVENVVSLIDFRLLLALIIAALTIEWFIRKFNGLI